MKRTRNPNPSPICVVGDCYGIHHAKGLCIKHYSRMAKHGSTDKPKPPRRPSKNERWLRRVLETVETDECVKWPGAASKRGGYGTLTIAGEQHTAHNWALRLSVGPPPDGKPHACHSCSTKLCVNPRHLRWDSLAENNRDMLRDGTHVSGFAKHIERTGNHPVTGKPVADNSGLCDCDWEECSELAKTGGKCRRHYVTHRRRVQRLAEGKPLDGRRSEKVCEVDGCEGGHYGQGMCNMHYQRWRRSNG